MKRLITLSLTLGLAASGLAFAQQGDRMKDMHKDTHKDMPMNMSKDGHQGMKSSQSDKKQAMHQATGTVKSVDPAQGKVTIAHGPVESLKWPGMTMAFSVTDKTAFSKLKAGSKVEFTFTSQGSSYTIVDVK